MTVGSRTNVTQLRVAVGKGSRDCMLKVHLVVLCCCSRLSWVETFIVSSTLDDDVDAEDDLTRENLLYATLTCTPALTLCPITVITYSMLYRRAGLWHKLHLILLAAA